MQKISNSILNFLPYIYTIGGTILFVQIIYTIMNKFDKWNEIYKRECKMIEEIEKSLEPHKKARTHARLMRNKYKK